MDTLSGADLLGYLNNPFFDEGSDGGVQGDGTRKVPFGLDSMSLLQLDESSIRISFGLVSIEFNRLTEVADCALDISFSHPDNSAIVIGHGVSTVTTDCPVEIGQRPIQIAPIEP